MKKVNKLIVGCFIALSLLNPVPCLAEKKEVTWYVDERFDKLYDYIEKNKVEPVEMIKEAFKEYHIVCVGEMHDDSHRSFAIKNFKELSDVIDYFGIEVSMDYNDKEGKFDYERYARDNPHLIGGELAMFKAAIDAGIEVICLDDSPLSKKPRDEIIKDNIKKFKDKKILVWYGSHHVAKYDRGLEEVPFARRLMNDDIKAYNILLLTPKNDERLRQAILFYSEFRNDTFALKNLDKIPEDVYNYNMHLKELFMCFDALIYYVPENMKVFEEY